MRGEHDYHVERDRYSLLMLPDGSMALPGWSYTPAGNNEGQVDFKFRAGYGKPTFYSVQGLPLNSAASQATLEHIAEEWKLQFAFLGIRESLMEMGADTKVENLTAYRAVPDLDGESVEFVMRATWPRAVFDIYAALLRAPDRKHAVLVLYGNDPGASFDAGVAWAQGLARRVRFDNPGK